MPTRIHDIAPHQAVCANPSHGILIALDTIATLPTHASLAELHRICAAGDTTLYDDVGWQAEAWRATSCRAGGAERRLLTADRSDPAG